MFANLALRSIGSDLFNPSQMEKDLARLETFQLPPHEATGNAAASAGWSRDGPEGVMQLDYYSGSFAIQFAQLTYSIVSSNGRGNQICSRTLADPLSSRQSLTPSALRGIESVRAISSST